MYLKKGLIFQDPDDPYEYDYAHENWNSIFDDWIIITDIFTELDKAT